MFANIEKNNLHKIIIVCIFIYLYCNISLDNSLKIPYNQIMLKIDTGDFYNAGLEEADTRLYKCSCGFELEVFGKYNPEAGEWRPYDVRTVFCSKCDGEMYFR